MRLAALLMLSGAALAGVSCGEPTATTHIVCNGTPGACECDVVSTYQTGSTSSCSQASIPGALCCAGSEWPSSGSCTCASTDVFCGVVPGYFTGQDGGPRQDGCVCSGDAEIGGTQAVGAACYPDGTTTAGDGLGICCSFSADAPGADGAASCSCAAGLHTCGAGGMAVASCSASNVAPVAQSCEGDTQVSSCQ